MQPAGKSKPISLADNLKLRIQYERPFPAPAGSFQQIQDWCVVSPQEAAEYWAFVSGEQIKPEQLSQEQCWQFSAYKANLYTLENIPFEERLDFSRSLLAWHPIVCKYDPISPDSGDSWLKSWAERSMKLEAFEIQHVQLLAVGEAPKPVPEVVLKEIRDGLQQQIEQQKAILAQLRHQQVPLWVQAGKEMKLVWPADICFITSEAKAGLDVFTVAGERWPCFQTLSVLEQQLLTEPDFMRTSRQHIVNLSHIDLVQPAGRGRDLTFKGQPADTKARVTDNYLKAFLERLKG